MSFDADKFLQEHARIMTKDMVRSMAILNALSHEVNPNGTHFVDHPDDPGGATNWGISLRFLKGVGVDVDGDGDIDADDIRALTLDQASDLYIKEFWEPYGIDKLPPRLAVKVFDMAVNMGPKQAIKILQETLRWFAKYVEVDGVIGPQTLRAVAHWGSATIIDDLRKAVGNFYLSLISNNPAFSVFQRGWLKRART